MIPRDKALHFGGGSIIAVLFTCLLNADTGFFAAAMAGIAKEVYDSAHKERHTPEFLDAVATAAGGLCIWIIWTI